jgi:hypothetical protein
VGTPERERRCVDGLSQLVTQMDLDQINRLLEFHALRERAAELLAGADDIRDDLERRRMTIEAKPTAIDFSGCRSVGEMSQAQFSAWCDAGQPPLEAPTSRRGEEGITLRKTNENALVPAPAPSGDDVAMGVLQSEVFKNAMGYVIADLRAEWRAAIEDKVAELRAAATKTEIDDLRGEVARLRESIGGKVTILSPTKGKTDAA